jgi:glycosyltransferase involved in cell wall biosynthesis
MRTYWNAHRLAAQGHEVHVMTNAKEVSAPYRMFMRPVDWQRCEAAYGAGSVTMHWTEPVDDTQSYIPMASPFITKLAGTAARVHWEHAFDVIYSHYLEPYGVAGHLAAEMTGAPHVVRMAGSDSGCLWHHPQFEDLYDHVLRSAEVVIASGAVAQRAYERGVDRARIAVGGGFLVPEDLFTPTGPVLDLSNLRSEVAADPDAKELLWGEFVGDRPYFGLFGKLGDAKGSFSLLAAMEMLNRSGVKVGLVALAHGDLEDQGRFRAMASQLGIADCVLQIPFIPHWRVPEFLRGCLAACCLEQDFSIKHHYPMVTREALLCCTCLVASTEVIRKLPLHRLPHGYGCVAIENVNDTEELASRLAAVASEPELARTIGCRGASYAREMQRNWVSPPTLESVLQCAVGREPIPATIRWFRAGYPTRGSGYVAPPLHAAVDRGGDDSQAPDVSPLGLPEDGAPFVVAHQIVIPGGGDPSSRSPAARVAEAIVAAERQADEAGGADERDPLFRFRAEQWAMADDALGGLVPVRAPKLRIVEFDFDVSRLYAAQSAAETAALSRVGARHIVVFGRSAKRRREPLLVDERTVEILTLCDGTRTGGQIAGTLNRASDERPATVLNWIERLFVSGLLNLQDTARYREIKTLSTEVLCAPAIGVANPVA